ncbi:MAG TPA: S41 family peptidase [Candidatus Elarobacter sp.]|jgi:C-terminal processing protease CtpA/Prc|nr:S41 family peptidase [Candidatus Elarobacter sp.]
MRLLASFAAAVFAFASVPGHAGAASPSREEALIALCRVWNAVRFLHPALASETDARWDDALIAAEPIVERDPGALREAAAAMVATLHDPLTTVDAERTGPGSALPSVEDRDGIRVVRLNGFPADDGFEAYMTALGDALKTPANEHAMVIDLRTGAAAPSFEQIAVAQYLWQQAHLAASVIDRPVTMPPVAQRYFLGFPPETSGTTGDYAEGRETRGSETPIAPAKGSRAVAVAFVVDAYAIVPPDALALRRAGRAAIFSADGSPGIVPGSGQILDAGSGLRFAMRTFAPLETVRAAPGGFDAALAWARDPKPAAAEMFGAADAAVPATPIEQRYAGKELPDEAHRVLAAFRVWGTIAYVYPYKSLMHDDWDAALRTALADLHGASTPVQYDLALQKFYAHLHDTHGFTVMPALAELYGGRPSFVAGDVEGKPTIRYADPLAAKRDGFAVGDVIEAVDGEPVAARWARLRPYIVASTEQSARAQFDNTNGRLGLLTGPVGSIATLRLRGADGRVREVRTPRTAAPTPYAERTRPVVDVLPGNVGYVDLARLERADAEPALVRLAGTRALVFDLRGYPRGTAWVLGPHFAPSVVRAALFRTPMRRTPIEVPNGAGLEFVDQTRDFYQMIEPKAPRYAKPVVVVIDPRAISQSEHTALYLAASAHARFVGEPTTGANGDVTRFYVPGGVMMMFTGQAVMHPDGAQLQRVGIVPDVRVAPTLRGVRAGDDEVLSAGLREALRLAHTDPATSRAALAEERAKEHGDALARTNPPAPPPVAADAPLLPDAFASHGEGYDGGHDPALRHRDGRTIVLRAKPDATSAGFGTYSETFDAAPYRGKRVRISGVLRSEGAKHGSFWMRVDGPAGMESFDNMNGRDLAGTRDWTPFAIVLDVPADAKTILAGLLLQGDAGAVWADDLRIEVVDPRVPTTGTR